METATVYTQDIKFDTDTATVYTQFNEFDIDVNSIDAYVDEMRAQKGYTDTDYCETVEVDDRGRVSALINGRGEYVAQFEYDN